jgi:hypothetical protein
LPVEAGIKTGTEKIGIMSPDFWLSLHPAILVIQFQFALAGNNAPAG